MNYVQRVIQQLESLGCDQELTNLYALLALVKGEDTTLEDIHDAWSVWRNNTNPDHKSLIPFDELTPEVQELDRMYRDAVRDAA